MRLFDLLKNGLVKAFSRQSKREVDVHFVLCDPPRPRVLAFDESMCVKGYTEQDLKEYAKREVRRVLKELNHG